MAFRKLFKPHVDVIISRPVANDQKSLARKNSVYERSVIVSKGLRVIDQLGDLAEAGDDRRC